VEQEERTSGFDRLKLCRGLVVANLNICIELFEVLTSSQLSGKLVIHAKGEDFLKERVNRVLVENLVELIKGPGFGATSQSSGAVGC
jgi:hypothetical protein